MLTPEDIAGCQTDQLAALWDRCTIRQPDSWAGETRTEGAIGWTWLNDPLIPCRVATVNTQPATIPAGGETVMLTRIMVTLPPGVCPTEDQVITITTASIDGSLVGRRFVVRHAEPSTFLTARRVACVEVL